MVHVEPIHVRPVVSVAIPIFPFVLVPPLSLALPSHPPLFTSLASPPPPPSSLSTPPPPPLGLALSLPPAHASPLSSSLAEATLAEPTQVPPSVDTIAVPYVTVDALHIGAPYMRGCLVNVSTWRIVSLCLLFSLVTILCISRFSAGCN